VQDWGRRKEEGKWTALLVKLIKDGLLSRETGHPAQLAEKPATFAPRVEDKRKKRESLE